MANAIKSFRVTGMKKRAISQLAAEARRQGMSPEQCACQLIEEALEMRRDARTHTFAEIMNHPAEGGEEIDFEELDRLVDEARTRQHERVMRNKNR